MKIGILTFHWANNYGAVLQAYALQNFLECMGHQVDMINYCPEGYSYDFFDLLIPRNVHKLSILSREFIRTRKIDRFRKKYLKLTRRISKSSDLESLEGYDVFISGSDQVLNPFFTTKGEGIPTPAYYLATVKAPLKIGYAISFGCNEYPTDALNYALKWIQCFNKIAVRENSGLEILRSLKFKNLKSSIVVPDPVVLNYKHLVSHFNLLQQKSDYSLFYLLHNKKYHKISNNLKNDSIPVKAIKGTESIEDWLDCISKANFVLTNSYHGTIVSILSHSEFAVIIENDVTSSMNDRFSTLLSRLNLLDRIIVGDDTERVNNLKTKPISWEEVDSNIRLYSGIGENFLKSLL